ncbi:MAG TPA: hypothetical protein PLJ29_07240, partial [Leptospiraceae bacterium]|nr:hypothetical protein [Leptospiraceae bacterium]
ENHSAAAFTQSLPGLLLYFHLDLFASAGNPSANGKAFKITDGSSDAYDKSDYHYVMMHPVITVLELENYETVHRLGFLNRTE